MNKVLIIGPIIILVSVALGVGLFVMMEGENQTVINTDSISVRSPGKSKDGNTAKGPKNSRGGISLTDEIRPGKSNGDESLESPATDVASATGEIGSATGRDGRIAAGPNIRSVTRMAPDGSILELSSDGSGWIRSGSGNETDYASGTLASGDESDSSDLTGSDSTDSITGTETMDDTTLNEDPNATPTSIDDPGGERCSISGVVRNLDGDPVSGATVRCQLEESYPGAEGIGASGGSGVTDERGAYRIGGLAAGRFNVQATGPSGDTSTTNVTLSPGQDLSGVDFQLDEIGGSISGRVTDAQTGQPISGAIVAADMEDSPYQASDIIDPVQTDGSGYFEIGGLIVNPNVEYSLTVDAKSQGYALGILTRQRPPLVGLQITLSKGVPVEGHVYYEETTEPVANATVEARRNGQIEATADTDETGFYQFEQLAAGNYEIVAYTEDQISKTRRLSVPSSETQPITGIDLTIRPGGGFKGKVTDSRSSPIEGADIEMYRQGLDMRFVLYKRGISAAEGAFEFLGLPGGTYYFAAEKDGLGRMNYSEHMSIGDAEVREGILLELPKAAMISGRVTDGQIGIPSVLVEVVGYPQVSSKTGSDGKFELTNMDGNWTTVTLQFSKDGFTTDRRDSIPIGTTDLEVALKGGGTVSGTVKNKKTGMGIYNAEVTVEVKDLGGNDTYYDPSPRYTNNQGVYQVKGVPLQSSIRVKARHADYDEDQKDSFMPAEGQVTVDLQLDPGITVEGTVVDAGTRQGIPEVKVTVGNDNEKWANTDSNGRYEIEGVPVGKPPFTVQELGFYGSFFRPVGTDTYDTIHFLDVNEQNYQIDLEMAEGAVIFGKVTDAADRPISGARISVMNMPRNVTTGGDGAYRLPGLPTRTPLRLVITADGYEEKWMDPNDYIYDTVGENELNWRLLRGGTVKGVLNFVGGDLSVIRTYDINVRAHCLTPDGQGQIEHTYRDDEPTGGTYTLPYLTPGRYRVEVWQRKPSEKMIISTGEFHLADEQIYQIPGALDVPM